MTTVLAWRSLRIRLPLMLFLASMMLALPAGAQGCPPLKTGLVLSGGGAKGSAHIGVFKILDSLHIRPDFIIGQCTLLVLPCREYLLAYEFSLHPLAAPGHA